MIIVTIHKINIYRRAQAFRYIIRPHASDDLPFPAILPMVADDLSLPDHFPRLIISPYKSIARPGCLFMDAPKPSSRVKGWARKYFKGLIFGVPREGCFHLVSTLANRWQVHLDNR